jgi:hypothetical protein
MPLIVLALVALGPPAQARDLDAPPTAPAVPTVPAAPACEVVVLSGVPPQAAIDWNCIDAPDAALAPGPVVLMCAAVGLSGIPPQPVINWDCIDLPVRILYLR